MPRIEKRQIGRPPRLSESVSERIHEDCVAGRAAGTRLPTEGTLVDAYGVSRRTVRAALARLEKQKLIIRRSARGAFVAKQPHLPWIRFAGKQIGLSYGGPADARGSLSNAEVIHGILRALSHTGINLMQATRNWRRAGGKSSADHFASRINLGVFLLDAHSKGVLASLKSLARPMVAIDFDASGDSITSFCFDNVGAGALLARRLHRLGHRRIAAIFESPGRPARERSRPWSERREGFLAEMKRLGTLAPAEIHLPRRSSRCDVGAQVSRLLRRTDGRRPTAILVPHAGRYAEVEAAARARKLSIPRDLTIVAFEGAAAASAVTAVRFYGAELGAAAADHMLRLIRDRKLRRRKAPLVRIKGRYVAGRTHARPRS